MDYPRPVRSVLLWSSLLLAAPGCFGFAASPALAHHPASRLAVGRQPSLPVAAPIVAGAAVLHAVPPGHSRSAAAAVQMKANKDMLELEGVVLEALPNANFRNTPTRFRKAILFEYASGSQ